MTFTLTHAEIVSMIAAGWLTYAASAINLLRVLARRREAKEVQS
jgi:hypothetical protein